MMSLPKNAQLWLPALVGQRAQSTAHQRPGRGAHVMLAIADHYEPFNGGVSQAQADRRVARWRDEYPRAVEGLRDADGREPQHSFFYPAEQYDAEHVEQLAALVERRLAEIEVHLHHDGDTSDNLRRTLVQFTDRLRERHGLLTRYEDGRTAYAFVHGNWALDNARPDGRYCGVNDELTVLKATGCFADFTLPGVPDASQTRTVNSIYYAIDDPDRPRSHDYGVRAAVGRQPPVDGLLMVQGPLALDWSRRRYGVFPGVECGSINDSAGHRPDSRRFPLWVSPSICVDGRPDWIFVKAHTHGAHERNADLLLGSAMRRFHTEMLEQVAKAGLHLHYVTVREMANIVRAAEEGAEGNPGLYRDYWLPPPGRVTNRRRPVRPSSRLADGQRPARVDGGVRRYSSGEWRGPLSTSIRQANEATPLEPPPEV